MENQEEDAANAPVTAVTAVAVRTTQMEQFDKYCAELPRLEAALNELLARGIETAEMHDFAPEELQRRINALHAEGASLEQRQDILKRLLLWRIENSSKDSLSLVEELKNAASELSNNDHTLVESIDFTEFLFSVAKMAEYGLKRTAITPTAGARPFNIWYLKDTQDKYLNENVDLDHLNQVRKQRRNTSEVLKNLNMTVTKIHELKAQIAKNSAFEIKAEAIEYIDRKFRLYNERKDAVAAEREKKKKKAKTERQELEQERKRAEGSDVEELSNTFKKTVNLKSLGNTPDKTNSTANSEDEHKGPVAAQKAAGRSKRRGGKKSTKAKKEKIEAATAEGLQQSPPVAAPVVVDPSQQESIASSKFQHLSQTGSKKVLLKTVPAKSQPSIKNFFATRAGTAVASTKSNETGFDSTDQGNIEQQPYYTQTAQKKTLPSHQNTPATSKFETRALERLHELFQARPQGETNFDTQQLLEEARLQAIEARRQQQLKRKRSGADGVTRNRRRRVLIIFHDSKLQYTGAFEGRSTFVSGRHPLRTDPTLNYDLDSDEEGAEIFGEEVDQSGQESDVEEEEEVCSDFDLVPDGELLSSEGLLSDDDAEERQNLQTHNGAQKAQRDKKRLARAAREQRIQHYVFQHAENDEQVMHHFQQEYQVIAINRNTFPIPIANTASEKAAKVDIFEENDYALLKRLIFLVHGSYEVKVALVTAFQEQLRQAQGTEAQQTTGGAPAAVTTTTTTDTGAKVLGMQRIDRKITNIARKERLQDDANNAQCWMVDESCLLQIMNESEREQLRQQVTQRQLQKREELEKKNLELKLKKKDKSKEKIENEKKKSPTEATALQEASTLAEGEIAAAQMALAPPSSSTNVVAEPAPNRQQKSILGYFQIQGVKKSAGGAASGAQQNLQRAAAAPKNISPEEDEILVVISENSSQNKEIENNEHQMQQSDSMEIEEQKKPEIKEN